MGMQGARARVFPLFAARVAAATSPVGQGQGAPPFDTRPTLDLLGGYGNLRGVIG
jgi:hypothetical protein